MYNTELRHVCAIIFAVEKK